jgi:hypothetical protein
MYSFRILASNSSGEAGALDNVAISPPANREDLISWYVPRMAFVTEVNDETIPLVKDPEDSYELSQSPSSMSTPPRICVLLISKWVLLGSWTRF